MSEKFRQRMELLQQELNKCVGNDIKGKSCVSVLLVIGAIVPILVWFFLYFLKPRFVTDEEITSERNGEIMIVDQVRKPFKVVFWTLIISAIIWVILYSLTYCESFNTGLACLFS